MTGKLKSAGAVILVCALIFALVHIVHFQFLTVSVVLYGALLDVVIAVLVTAALIGLKRTGRGLERFEAVQTLAICALLGYGFAITMPTVIDRSLSLYILEKLQQRGGGLPRGDMADVFRHEYMAEHRLIEVRLTEQQHSGTIIIDGDCVRLTTRGDLIARFGRFYRGTLLPPHRDIMGQVTDALTDPFRNSSALADNPCTER